MALIAPLWFALSLAAQGKPESEPEPGQASLNIPILMLQCV